MAFILVTREETHPPQESEFDWLQKMRQNFTGYYHEWTLNRGTMNTDLSSLTPPSNLRITRIIMDQAYLSGNKIIELKWDPYEHPRLAGYNLYRRATSSGILKQIYGISADETSFRDIDCLPYETYVYALTVFTQDGESSGFSNIVAE